MTDRGEIISAGNFHGEYPAKACDYLAIAVHEMASMSERRIERLVNPGESKRIRFSGELLATQRNHTNLLLSNKILVINNKRKRFIITQ